MSWQLFDRIAAFFRQTNVYRNENLLQDQSSIARIAAGGFSKFSSSSSLIDQTNLQINRLERYKDFDQMDQVGEISASLDMYADEASLLDNDTHHSLMVKSGSLRVKEELEDFFYNTLNIDNILRPMVRYLCKYGDFPSEIIPTQKRNGIASIRHMNVYNFTRVETKYGDLVGFFYQNEFSSEPTFFHPWQVMHLRLTSYENIYAPYGRSLLDGARKHFKQLRLMEDAAIVYRLTRSPERRVFKIPVGNIPAKEVSGYMEQVAREFKKKKIYDQGSGDVSERWSPLIQEDDYWLPMRADGSGPSVETLPGAQNLDQIADIEYFKKKMVSALKIPFSRVGIGETTDGDSQPLSKVAPEFAKACQWIQREVVTGLKKIAIVHLALRGLSADEIRDFTLHMTASSAIDELYRIETWAARADVIDSLKSTELFPDRWILKRFTNMTDDEIDQMKNEAKKDGASGDKGGDSHGPSNSPIGTGSVGGGLPPLESVLPPLEGGGGEGAPVPSTPEAPEAAFAELPVETSVPESKNTKDAKARLITENSGYDYYLSTNELDGMTTSAGEIKSILTEDIIDTAKSIAKTLMEEERKPNSSKSDEITEEDIP